MFKEEAVLSVWQSELKVLKNWSPTQRENVCTYGKWREQWNVRQGRNGNTELGLFCAVFGVILNRNDRPEIYSRRTEKILKG